VRGRGKATAMSSSGWSLQTIDRRFSLERKPADAPPSRGDERMRPLAWLIVAIALLHSTATVDAETLTCSTWQGITTCSSPDAT